MVRILYVAVTFRSQRLLMPLHLSTGIIEMLTEAEGSVIVEIEGRRATGRGAVYLSDLWAWPDHSLSHNERDRVLLCILRANLQRIAEVSKRQVLPPIGDGFACARAGLPSLADDAEPLRVSTSDVCQPVRCGNS